MQLLADDFIYGYHINDWHENAFVQAAGSRLSRKANTILLKQQTCGLAFNSPYCTDTSRQTFDLAWIARHVSNFGAFSPHKKCNISACLKARFLA